MSIRNRPEVLSAEEMEQIHMAKCVLEGEPFLLRASGLLGSGVEAAIKQLPKDKQQLLIKGTEKVLLRTLAWSTKSLRAEKQGLAAWDWTHKAAVFVSGAAGGFYGLPGAMIEMPVTTLVMMRSICDIAREHGEDLRSPEAQLTCVEVLSFGGDEARRGYYAARLGMTGMLADAASHLGGKAATPQLLQFIRKVAERFALSFSETLVVKAIPFVGAATGAAINALFMDYYQDLARAHFSLRRLERMHGFVLVQEAYQAASTLGAGKNGESDPA